MYAKKPKLEVDRVSTNVGFRSRLYQQSFRAHANTCLIISLCLRYEKGAGAS